MPSGDGTRVLGGSALLGQHTDQAGIGTIVLFLCRVGRRSGWDPSWTTPPYAAPKKTNLGIP
jgi:hypothetical protein